MLITPHVAIGCAIGAKIDNHYLVALLSFASHYLLDMLPHYDSGVRHGNPQGKITFDLWDWVLVIGDILLALAMMWYFYEINQDINIIIGGMTTFMVDFLDKIFFVSWKNGKLSLVKDRYIPVISEMNRFHKKVHYKLSLNKWYWGVVIQLIVLIVGGYICLLKY